MSKASIMAQPDVAEATDRDWVVVAVSAIGLILSLGTLLLYTFGVFAGPLIREFGWTRTQASGALAVSQYTVALCAPAWGLLIDRFGPRPLRCGPRTGGTPTWRSPRRPSWRAPRRRSAIPPSSSASSSATSGWRSAWR